MKTMGLALSALLFSGHAMAAIETDRNYSEIGLTSAIDRAGLLVPVKLGDKSESGTSPTLTEQLAMSPLPIGKNRPAGPKKPQPRKG